MRAADLDQAICWQNQPAYGLTAGLHALDPKEIDRWRAGVHAGNLYVNRGTTGAIVRRQPFGGWKRSVVGPGAKAGGPNYVASLGTWPGEGSGAVGFDYAAACREAWAAMQVADDPTAPRAEANAFRYCALERVALCRGAGVDDRELAWALAAAAAVGVRVEVVDEATVVDRAANADKVRLLGPIADATRLAVLDTGCWVDDIPVAAGAGREILRWVRAQAVSETLHRHGNISDRRPGLPRRLGPS